MSMQEPERTTIQKHVLYSLTDCNKTIIDQFKKYTELDAGGGVMCIENKTLSNRLIVAVCSAGLGNRLLTIVGALYWAKRLNFNLKIYWDRSTCCLCSYKSLFDGLYNSIYNRKTFCKFLKNNVNNDSTISTYGSNQIEFKKLINKDIILYNDSVVPYYISYDTAKNILKELKVKKNILNKAQTFIQKFGINNKTIGLHIRKIDPPEQRTGRKFLPLSLYKKIIEKNINNNFFICSDSYEVEKEFINYKNINIYKKEKYPEYNVLKDITYRDSTSVINGFVDMIILSHTNIYPLCLQLSSFCKTAKCLPVYDFK
jgi:hypothetical protein